MSRTSLSGALLRVLLLGSVAASCAAPTLPLPPPNTEAIWNVDGILEVHGSGAEAGALCFCLNETRENGIIVIAEDDGTFVCTMPQAEPGDLLSSWYEVGFDKSHPSDDIVPERPTPQ